MTQINPQWFAELKNLEQLELSENKITRLDLMALCTQLPYLQFLWLHKNQLNQLELQNRPEEQELDLSNLDLDELDLRNNRLTEDEKKRLRELLTKIKFLRL